MVQPGTFRDADGTALPYSDAVPAWSEAALPVLLDTAHVYNAVITYKELGEPSRSCGDVSAAAGRECGGVAPGLCRLVQHRDSAGGRDGQTTVGVQHELEALGVNERVVPGADQDQIC